MDIDRPMPQKVHPLALSADFPNRNGWSTNQNSATLPSLEHLDVSVVQSGSYSSRGNIAIAIKKVRLIRCPETAPGETILPSGIKHRSQRTLVSRVKLIEIKASNSTTRPSQM